MDIEAIAARADAGAQWMIGNQDAEGSWETAETEEIDAYYKASWALLRSGHYGAAHRTLDYIANTFLSSVGDLEPRSNSEFFEVSPLYPNVYVIIGSSFAGRYDLKTPAIRFLLSRQDPVSGGFFSQRGELGHASQLNVYNTAASGIASLAAGELEAARRAGEFIESVIDAQPEEDRFYTTLDVERELITDPAEDDEFYQLLDLNTPDQYWGAHMGLPFVLLTQLGQATGKQRYLDLASWLFDYQKRGVDPWGVSSSGKMAWGTSMWYRMTGEEEYREIALRIAEDVIIHGQAEDGHWDLYGTNPYGDDKDVTGYSSIEFDITAEFTLWLAIVAENLRAGDAR